MKKKKEKTIIFVVIIGIILLLFAITPLPSILGLTTPTFCEIDPYHPDCICPENTIKTKGGSPFQWVCIGQKWPADDSTECAWCNGECVNWKLYGNYSECDRDPLFERSCQAIEGYCDDVPFEYKEGLVTFCSEEDWYKFVEEFPGTNRELNAYLAKHCTGTYWQDGCKLEYSTSDELWTQYFGPDSGLQNIVMECLSQCYDNTGKIVGGKVLYEIVYKIENGELLGPYCPTEDWCLIDVGCYDPTSEVSCCYNEGIENPYKQTFSLFYKPVKTWMPK